MDPNNTTNQVSGQASGEKKVSNLISSEDVSAVVHGDKQALIEQMERVKEAALQRLRESQNPANNVSKEVQQALEADYRQKESELLLALQNSGTVDQKLVEDINKKKSKLLFTPSSIDVQKGPTAKELREAEKQKKLMEKQQLEEQQRLAKIEADKQKQLEKIAAMQAKQKAKEEALKAKQLAKEQEEQARKLAKAQQEQARQLAKAQQEQARQLAKEEALRAKEEALRAKQLAKEEVLKAKELAKQQKIQTKNQAIAERLEAENRKKQEAIRLAEQKRVAKMNEEKNRLQAEEEAKKAKELAKNQELARKQAEKLKHKEESNFRYIMTFLLFVGLGLLVYFLPNISEYMAVLRAEWEQSKQPPITTGDLVCEMKSTTNKFDITYESRFGFSDSRLNSLIYSVSTRGDITADEDELTALLNECETLENATKNLEGVYVSCALSSSTVHQQQEFNYASLSRENVTTAYVEAGGTYPEFEYLQNIDEIEKIMKASGYTCERYR